MRDIVDAIRYLTHNGPVWRALPADFPPAWTVYYWAGKWEADGATARMHDDLRECVRAAAGRRPAPTAAIIDSQSVKGSEMVARGGRGYDAGKKITGKRHIAVDTLGLLLTVLITAASTQDRDGAKPLLWNLRRAFPSIALAWADGGYAGKLVTWAKTRLTLTWKSSRGPMTCTPSRFCPAGGWSSGHCRGSPAAGGPSATTNGCQPTTRPTSTGP
jgi:putative transposase